MSMWVPNSERGPKIQSLEGKNEIPQIALLEFTKFHLKFHQQQFDPNRQKSKIVKKSIRAMWGISFSPSSDWILGPLSEFGIHMSIVNLGY